MQNYKVSIAYDGSSFYGFQKQRSRPTVQGKIEEVLDLLIKDYELNYSGRTDAGVHAKEQVLNILTDIKICLLYTSPSPRDGLLSRMPSSA